MTTAQFQYIKILIKKLKYGILGKTLSIKVWYAFFKFTQPFNEKK